MIEFQTFLMNDSILCCAYEFSGLCLVQFCEYLKNNKSIKIVCFLKISLLNNTDLFQSWVRSKRAPMDGAIKDCALDQTCGWGIPNNDNPNDITYIKNM